MRQQAVENKVPAIIEMEGDQLTPISILQKIKGSKKFLLESSQKHQDTGRFSFIGTEPVFELISKGDISEIIGRNGSRVVRNGNPLQIVKDLLPAETEHNFPFPFNGGAFGYVGYDIVRHYENIGPKQLDELNMPDLHLMFYEEIIIFDHLQQKVSIIGNKIAPTSTWKDIRKRMRKRQQEILGRPNEQHEDHVQIGEFRHLITKEEFMAKVDKAKKYILSGDIFQVVLSQRMKATFTGNPLKFYRKLRIENPTPFMYFIEFENYKIAGSSPESLIKVSGSDVYINPIAGTKRRGIDNDEDQRFEIELKEDQKEIAEHRMLVDLGRNDLGRICEFGSVSISKYMSVEKFKHVMHLVSEAHGRLRNGLNGLDALASCLPAGTVSGAPKIRAMELINEMEKSKRGVYGGAIGYISANGNIDFALGIRTMILKEGYAFIQAGAGIVHDSKPEQEYEETINKLKGFLGEQL